jgi:hypothetical protein
VGLTGGAGAAPVPVAALVSRVSPGGVALGRLQLGVTQQFAQAGQGQARFDRLPGESVAQLVRGQLHPDLIPVAM